MTRDELLLQIYGVTTQKDLQQLFKDELIEAKRLSHSKQYIRLLELITHYFYAISFDYSTATINNHRTEYRKIAKTILDDKIVSKVFSFLNSPVKSQAKEKQIKDIKVDDKCEAITQITRLQTQLIDETYTLTRGQKEEDKRAYIKVSILALATGSRLTEIMEKLEVTTKDKQSHFNGVHSKILVIDISTTKKYLKEIREHYHERLIKKVDISTGLRKAIKQLDISGAGNINDLNKLYRDCLDVQ